MKKVNIMKNYLWNPISRMLFAVCFGSIFSGFGLQAQPTPPAVPAGLSPNVSTATATPAATERTVGGASTIRLPLRQLIGAEEPIFLRNSTSTYTVYVPLSPRYNVKSCKLHLRFTNSIALLSERSVMRVVLNNKIIGQFYLTRDQPFHNVDIEVPLEYFDLASNELQFIVAQHYTLECEEPAAPELYTEVLPDESYFEAVVTMNDIYPKLSLLRDLIDRKLWDPYKFHITMPGGAGAGMTDESLALGSVVTQGVTLNLDYRPAVVTTGNALLPGVDNIVIGTSSELTPYLSSTEIGSINGSFIAVKQLPGDPERFMLLISGRSNEEVAQAAYAFSLINFPLPDSQYAQISQIDFPDEPFYLKNAPIRDPGIYSFRQLGYDKTRTIKGFNTGSYQVEAYMPGDLSNEDASNVELRLHFVYGAALRSDSVLNIFVNQEFQRAVRLDDIRGALHDDHRVYLPVQAFQPGRNVVDIAPRMVPLITDQCELQQVENLLFTLYNDSDFVVPNLARKTRLPNFSLFSQTGFPFTASPDGFDLSLMVSSRDNVTICAAWMLMGKMAQINSSIMNRAEITFSLPRSDKNLIVVGPVDTLPAEIMDGAPVSPQEIGRARYLVSVSPKAEAAASGPVDEFLAKLRGIETQRGEPQQPATITMAMQSTLKDDSVAVSFQNPFHVGRAATVFTAASPDILYRGLYNLQDRRYWDHLAGSLMVWNNKSPNSLASARLGPEFVYGVSSTVFQATNSINRNPWLFTILVFGAIGIVAFLLWSMLKQKEKPAK